MLYLATASTPLVRDAMRRGLLGQMVTPAEGKMPLPGVTFAADNGCFGKGYPGDERWLAWLDRQPRTSCIFAVAPDVIGDAVATAARSGPYLPTIRSMGFPAAYVAQDGQERFSPPWDEFDVLFIGGTTSWKLDIQARRLTTQAIRRGKHVHMGRVNSLRRHRYADAIGCKSVDGTYLIWGPDVNLPIALGWVHDGRTQRPLFDTQEES